MSCGKAGGCQERVGRKMWVGVEEEEKRRGGRVGICGKRAIYLCTLVDFEITPSAL